MKNIKDKVAGFILGGAIMASAGVIVAKSPDSIVKVSDTNVEVTKTVKTLVSVPEKQRLYEAMKKSCAKNLFTMKQEIEAYTATGASAVPIKNNQ